MVNTIIHSNTNIYAYMYVPMIKSYLRLTFFPSLSYFFLILTYSFFPSTESEKDEFRLLCADGTRAPLSSFRTCNLGRGPGEGVVTRMNTRKIARKFLATAQVFYVGAQNLPFRVSVPKCGLCRAHYCKINVYILLIYFVLIIINVNILLIYFVLIIINVYILLIYFVLIIISNLIQTQRFTLHGKSNHKGTVYHNIFNSAIIYSPSCCLKLYNFLFCGTQKQIF